MTGYVADLSWKSGVPDWKVRSTKVDAGDFKHELLNRLRSTMEVNVLRWPGPNRGCRANDDDDDDKLFHQCCTYCHTSVTDTYQLTASILKQASKKKDNVASLQGILGFFLAKKNE